MRIFARVLPIRPGLQLFLVVTAALAGCGEDKSLGPKADSAANSARDGAALAVDASASTDPGKLSDASAPADAATPSDAAATLPEAAAPSLVLTGTVPSDVAIADLVTLYGKGFATGATILLEGASLVPTVLSSEVLTFVMPPVSLEGCRRDVALTLRSGDGRVAATTLNVVSRGPTVTPVKQPVRAGDDVELTGSSLARARAYVAARELVIASTGPSRIDVSIPRDLPVGATSLRVADACGSVDVALQILARVPQLNSVEPVTLAAGGVAYVSADVVSQSDVLAAHVGSVRIAPDAADLQWFESGGRDMLAVRMPRNLPAGPVDIVLEGSTGMSEPFPVMGVTASPVTPPSPGSIVIAPDGVATETFPIVTTGNSIVTELGATEYNDREWNYSFGTVANDDRCLTGRLFISENGVSTTDAGTIRVFGNLEGTYSVKGQENRVELVAQRGFEPIDGGVRTQLPPESYSGGVLSTDGGVAQAEACTNNLGYSNYTSSYLVLRSKSTGRQLVFRHGVIAQCPRQPSSPQCN